MKKIVIAFLLGVLSFLLAMFIGEGSGLPAAFATLAGYFFICQFLLSRGNPNAWRSDWRIMLALDAVTIIVVCIMVTAENRDVALAQAPGWLLSTCGGTFAGALAASLVARRTAH